MLVNQPIRLYYEQWGWGLNVLCVGFHLDVKGFKITCLHKVKVQNTFL